MRNRRTKMYRHRPNGRGFRHQSNNNEKQRFLPGSLPIGLVKNNFKPHQSVERLLERYKTLEKEALSSGDKILSENYLQHIDHFERMVSYKNLNQNENSSQATNVTKKQDNNLSSNSKIDQDHIAKNQDHIAKNKE